MRLCAGSFGSRRLEPSAGRVLRVLDNGLWSTADCGCRGGYVTHLYTHSQSVATHGVVCALKDESFRTALPFMRSDDRSMETPIPYTPCFYCVLKHRSGRIVDVVRDARTVKQ